MSIGARERTPRIIRGGIRLNGLRLTLRPLPSLAVALLLPLLIGLGLWQLDRAAQKEAILERYEANRTDLPIASVPVGADPQGLRYRRIALNGVWETNRHLLLDNRTHRGMAGFHLWSVLRLADGRGVLVNRGWLPLGLSRAELPEIPARDGAVTVAGMLDLPPPSGLVLGPDGPAAQGWPRIVQRIDLAGLAQELGFPLAPLVILEAPGVEPGLIQEWRPVTMGPERHRGYAVQWFALATALVVLFMAVSVHRTDKTDDSP